MVWCSAGRIYLWVCSSEHQAGSRPQAGSRQAGAGERGQLALLGQALLALRYPMYKTFVRKISLPRSAGLSFCAPPAARIHGCIGSFQGRGILVSGTPQSVRSRAVSWPRSLPGGHSNRGTTPDRGRGGFFGIPDAEVEYSDVLALYVLSRKFFWRSRTLRSNQAPTRRNTAATQKAV